VSIHKVNRIMRFRGGERKGEGRKKEERGEEKEWRGVGEEGREERKREREEGKRSERNLHHQIQKTWLDCICCI